jgi:hypothetical protein
MRRCTEHLVHLVFSAKYVFLAFLVPVYRIPTVPEPI